MFSDLRNFLRPLTENSLRQSNLRQSNLQSRQRASKVRDNPRKGPHQSVFRRLTRWCGLASQFPAVRKLSRLEWDNLI